MLDAKDIQRKRWRAHGYDAVFANDAVLFAATHQFAGKQQKRALAAVDQDKLVDRSARRLGNVNWAAITTSDHFFGATFSDDNFPGGQTLLQSQKGTGVLSVGSDDRKHGDVFVSNGIEDSPVPFRFGLGRGRRRGASKGLRIRIEFWPMRDESQTSERKDSQESAKNGGKNRALHKSLLCVSLDQVSGEPPQGRFTVRTGSAEFLAKTVALGSMEEFSEPRSAGIGAGCHAAAQAC